MFIGLELNERAVAIAQLVLWIGYFQWHKKTTGTADTKDRPSCPNNKPSFSKTPSSPTTPRPRAKEK